MFMGVGHVGRQFVAGNVAGTILANASLDLNFMQPGVLDPRVTFTRASTATYFDATGTMQNSPYNLVRNNTMVGAVVGSPGTLPTNWTNPAPNGLTTSVVSTGTNANGISYIDIRVSGSPTGTLYTLQSDSMATTASIPYTYSVWAAMVGGSLTNISTLRAAIGNSGGVSAPWNTTASLVRVSCTANTAATSYQTQFVFNTVISQPVDITVRIGLPQLEQTAAMSSTVALTSGAANGAPRWDYDPTALTLNGLLIEEARTNALRNSTFQGAVVGTPGTLPTNWTVNANATGLSFQVVSIGTENGIPCFDIRIFGTAVAAASYVIQLDTTTGIAALTAQTWCYSMYWRLTAGTLNGVTIPNLSLRETTSGGASVRDDSVVVGGPTNAALYSQRVTTGAVTLSGGATVASIQPRFFFSIANGAAVDMTLRIGAPQVEQGAFPTSYIPTTGAAVTRSADACIMTAANIPGGWYSGPGGSWYSEFINLTNPLTTGRRVIGAGPVTTSRTPSYVNPAGLFGQYDGAVLTTAVSITTGAISKGATTWAVGASKACLNAGAVATSAALASGYPFVTYGMYFLTNTAAASESMTGYIRRASYWPRILSNAEMQSVTT